MQTRNMKKNIFIAFITIILVPEGIAKTKRTCKISDVLLIGNKVFCESRAGLSISCFANALELKKAYVHCDSGYYSEQNISQQIIYCKDNGRWSATPMKCIPECSENPKSIELIDINKLTFPTSYVQVVRESPAQGKINLFPGIIISEREILTKCKYFDDDNSVGSDFQIKIYKSSTEFRQHNIHCSTHRNEDKKFQHEELCVLFVPFQEHIKYDEYTKPACRNLRNLPAFSENRYITSKFEQALVHVETKGCTVPHIDNTKVELTCFSLREENSLIDCSKEETVEQIKTRCQIGTINIKEDSKKHDSLLNVCHLNRWTIYGETSDCELICGKPANVTKTFVPLIHKGKKADIINAPWHVGIYANNTEISTKFEQICGGTIIHSNIIISAAHCFYNVAYGELYQCTHYLVGAGKQYRNYDITEETQQYANVMEMHIPPNYQPQSIQNDIAILILDHHLEFSAYIKPVCIDWVSFENYNIREGVEGYIFGWGAISRDVTSSSKLLTTKLTTVSNRKCKKHVHPNFRSEVTGDKFCAEHEAGGTACQGDSGGGFVIRKETETKDFRYYLIGVVSLGVDRKKYCSDGFLTLFTNLQFYQDMLKRLIAFSRG